MPPLYILHGSKHMHIFTYAYAKTHATDLYTYAQARMHMFTLCAHAQVYKPYAHRHTVTQMLHTYSKPQENKNKAHALMHTQQIIATDSSYTALYRTRAQSNEHQCIHSKSSDKTTWTLSCTPIGCISYKMILIFLLCTNARNNINEIEGVRFINFHLMLQMSTIDKCSLEICYKRVFSTGLI